MAAARITSFLVKVASRCNLDCDYCYVYHHADQSWRKMPQLLSAANQTSFAHRLAEYAREVSLRECFVVFHGGEPLLAGAEALARFVEQVRATVDAETKVEFGLQTNGLLLTDDALDILEGARIAVSLSLDGPRVANDLHRTTKRRRSSFDRVAAALERLKARPSVFAGVIAVIDATVSSETLFAYFDQHQPPKLDFLLPDAHHLRPPLGRDANPNLYADWLTAAFDLWLEKYPHLPIRFFETLLDAAAGLPSGTDALGLGDVSLLSIETDGTYHDLDVLKVVGDGATRLNGSVADTPISAIAASPAIERHRRLLAREGLCETCQACPVVEMCGGGSLPHRHGPNGFDHPSIYCNELKALIGHVKGRLAEALEADAAPPASRLPTNFDYAAFERAEGATTIIAELCADAEATYLEHLDLALDEMRGDGVEPAAARLRQLPLGDRRAAASWPGMVAWIGARHAVKAGKIVHDVDGVRIDVQDGYVAAFESDGSWREDLEAVHPPDRWLRSPFGDAIFFETSDVASRARPLVNEALAIVENWRPALAAEMRRACRTILFVRDPTAHPEKIVSFSDNSVPGALFVSVMQGDRFIDPYDLADSLIHEHRHQKLYLLERLAPMVRSTTDLVVSPWREDLRPPSGLLHAIFVFVELRRFWQHVRDFGPARMRERALNQLDDTDRHLAEGFQTLASCPLSEAGERLAAVLDRARLSDTALAAQ